MGGPTRELHRYGNLKTRVSEWNFAWKSAMKNVLAAGGFRREAERALRVLTGSGLPHAIAASRRFFAMALCAISVCLHTLGAAANDSRK